MANGHSSLTLCHSNSMKNIIGMKFLMLSYAQYYCYFALSLFRPLSPPLTLSIFRSPSLSLSCAHLKKKKIAAPFPDVRVVVAEQDEVSGKCSDTSTTTLQAQAQAHRHKLTSASTNTKANKYTTNSSKAQAHKHKHASTSINTQVHGQKHGNGAQT